MIIFPPKIYRVDSIHIYFLSMVNQDKQPLGEWRVGGLDSLSLLAFEFVSVYGRYVDLALSMGGSYMYLVLYRQLGLPTPSAAKVELAVEAFA